MDAWSIQRYFLTSTDPIQRPFFPAALSSFRWQRNKESSHDKTKQFLVYGGRDLCEFEEEEISGNLLSSLEDVCKSHKQTYHREILLQNNIKESIPLSPSVGGGGCIQIDLLLATFFDDFLVRE